MAMIAVMTKKYINEAGKAGMNDKEQELKENWSKEMRKEKNELTQRIGGNNYIKRKKGGVDGDMDQWKKG